MSDPAVKETQKQRVYLRGYDFNQNKSRINQAINDLYEKVEDVDNDNEAKVRKNGEWVEARSELDITNSFSRRSVMASMFGFDSIYDVDLTNTEELEASSSLFRVTDTGTLSTITNAGVTNNPIMFIIAKVSFIMSTDGNISVGRTVNQNEVVLLIYDGTKWFEI